jgi:hypothetical protein
MSKIYNINAHNSSVIVGNSGSVHIGADSSDMEAELLKVFRALPMRDRVAVMECAYRRCELIKRNEDVMYEQ